MPVAIRMGAVVAASCLANLDERLSLLPSAFLALLALLVRCSGVSAAAGAGASGLPQLVMSPSAQLLSVALLAK